MKKQREERPGREECLTMARSCLSANLRRTERLVTRHYDQHLAEAGVTAVQLPILATIASASEPTFRLLSENLELDRSTLSRNLNLLQRRGLLKLGVSSGPKPGLITLTPKGRDALARAHVHWLDAHRALEEAVAGSALTEGLGFLKKLRRAVRG
jgi:DNA-binding MarR family transcriptional regulator